MNRWNDYRKFKVLKEMPFADKEEFFYLTKGIIKENKNGERIILYFPEFEKRSSGFAFDAIELDGLIDSGWIAEEINGDTQ